MNIELQKASISKRIAAAILDFILLILIITGAAVLFSSIFGYDANLAAMEAREKHFETEYGIKRMVASNAATILAYILFISITQD